jgi:hypothetical protein
MSKYFKNVKSLEDLKNQFKVLARQNHPDAGGDAEVMKEINCEYDALFPIWKDRHNAAEPQDPITETADSTRRQFYTQFGWEGSRHDWNRDLKEVAQIVRAYVKEKYPTYRFSVRTSYASMCQELHVELKESPIEIYKPFETLTESDFQHIARCLYPWDYMYEQKIGFLDASAAEKKRIIEQSQSSYACILNDATQAVVSDVDAFVKSYNYSDCDGMTDYFDVDFYYFGCLRDNGAGVKIVPRTARTKKQAAIPAKTAGKGTTKQDQGAPGFLPKTGYTYKITRGEDTRDGSDLWIVRITETLDRAAYIAENAAMKARGGYYSKFKHGFIFRFDPAEILKTA